MAADPLSAPLAPVNLSATVENGNMYSSVTLSWSPAPNSAIVSEYDIYKNNSKCGSTSNTFYTIDNILNTLDYPQQFYVVAKNLAGNATSEPISIYVYGIPSAPSLSGISPAYNTDGSSVILSYYNVGNNVTKIIVVVTEFDVLTGSIISSTSRTVTNDGPFYGGTGVVLVSGLDYGKTYHFTATSENPAAVSGPSAPYMYNGAMPIYTVPIVAPSAPRTLSVTTTATTATISWNAPSQFGGVSSLTYQVKWYEGLTLIGESVNSITDTQYTIENLTTETIYTVEVYAINTAGSSSPATLLVTPAVAIPPPEDLEANIGNETISLLWFQPTSIIDSTGVTYRVEWYASGLIVGSHTLTATYYDITELTNGTEYTVKVFTLIGSDSSTATTIIKTPIAPPSAPQNVIATAGNNQVIISWTTVADVSYTISWAQGATFIDSVSGLTSSPYIVSGLTNGTEYTFTIVGANVAGPSSIVVVSNIPNIPSTPQSAVQNGNISTFIASQSAISPEIITDIRTEIKKMTDSTAKAAAKDSFITAMSEKQGTMPVITPITDFNTFKQTYDVLADDLSDADVNTFYPNVLNEVDLSFATSTTYTHIEMRLNTETTLKNGSIPFAKITYKGSGNFDLRVSWDGNNWSSSKPYSVSQTLYVGGKTFHILAAGSVLFNISDGPIPIEVNLNVEVNANGNLEILSQTPPSVENIVIASTKLPATSLYDISDTSVPLGLIEFWEPLPNYNEIECQLATNFKDSANKPAYKLMAKRLALGLQNVLMGELKAHNTIPFNDTKYGTAGQENGNRVMNGFGRLALMAYSHYIMGHVQATAAITNDKQFIQNMLSLKDTTSITAESLSLQETNYKYEVNASDSLMRIGDYDPSQKPWNVTESTADANLAARLVKKLITENIDANGDAIISKTSEVVSNPTKVANIVKQVIGQDASRATDDDNNKYIPEASGLLKFYANDVIYVSISLKTPEITIGNGQQIQPLTLSSLYNPSDAHKKYTLKITLE